MKYPLLFRIFAVLNLIGFLLLLLQSVLMITNPFMGLAGAAVSIVAALWLLLSSFFWFFRSRYSYAMLYLTAIILVALATVVMMFGLERADLSASRDFIIYIVYGAICFIYAAFLLVSLFFKPVKDWAKSVATPNVHTVPVVLGLALVISGFGLLYLINQVTAKNMVLESATVTEFGPNNELIVDFTAWIEFDGMAISTDLQTEELKLLVYFADNYDAREVKDFYKVETFVFKPVTDNKLVESDALPVVEGASNVLTATFASVSAKRIMIVPIGVSLNENSFNFSLLHRVKYFDQDKTHEQYIVLDGIPKPMEGYSSDEGDDLAVYGSEEPARELIENRDLPEPKAITTDDQTYLIQNFLQEIAIHNEPFLFNTDVPRMKIDNIPLGFYGGHRDILRYVRPGLQNMLATKNPNDERDLTLNDEVWELSGLGMYVNLEDQGLPFYGLNPTFISWIKNYILPEPKDKFRGVEADSVYHHLFRRSIWLLASSREYFKDQSFYEGEANAYRTAMDENGFFGPSYLAQRYIVGKSPAPIFKKLYDNVLVSKNEYFYFDEQIALGFWLRRKLDGSDDEMWDLVKTILDKYDSYPYEP